MRLFATVFTIFLGIAIASHAQEETVKAELASGGSKNNFAEEIDPFTAEHITDMTDGNDSSGFIHTSLFGDDFPSQISGVQKRFDFDVSKFSTISKLVFVWKGRYEWSAEVDNPLSTIWLGHVGPPYTLLKIEFGSTSDPTLRDGSIAFTGTDLAYILHDGLASVWVSSGFGTTNSTLWRFISIETVEVSAEITGTLAPTSVESTPWSTVKRLYQD